MLHLPLLELKILYTKHLILKELLINDVSLYILSLCFLHRKRLAFDFLEEKDKALPLLESLEDRYINGIVAYIIGYCSDNKNYYYYAYNIFKNKKNLLPKELHYMAIIYQRGKGGIIKNIEKAIEYYKLAGHISYVNLGCLYRDIQNDIIAVMFFEKAAALNDTVGKYNLAIMLEHGLGIAQNSNRSKELYISAAKDNNQYAIKKCKIMHWI